MGNAVVTRAARRARVTPDRATPNSREFDSLIGYKNAKNAQRAQEQNVVLLVLRYDCLSWRHPVDM